MRVNHCHWRDLDIDQVDALICDPPYGARTHAGHNAGAAAREYRQTARTIDYSSWGEADVKEFCDHWMPATRGWFCALTSHDLYPAWELSAMENKRYSFAPIPCILRGSGFRSLGDGPPSITCWLFVCRPRGKEWIGGWSMAGFYSTTLGARSGRRMGGKPLDLMSAIVRDYSRPNDLVCDPVCGYGTTLVAALANGRRYVGCDIDEECVRAARERLGGPIQLAM